MDETARKMLPYIKEYTLKEGKYPEKMQEIAAGRAFFRAMGYVTDVKVGRRRSSTRCGANTTQNTAGPYYALVGKLSNLRLPEQWQVHYKELTFNVKPMNFKHTGVFPEQAANWDFAMEKIRTAGRPISVLNLFAYTGGATIACAAAGASVCHVDAAKGMVACAKAYAG